MKTTLLSVGIDIGTTTTQVVFSRLMLENTAAAFSVPRVEIVGKETLYRGRVQRTPLQSENRLDGDSLRRMVGEEFVNAGLAHGEIDTGAVIITGEAARKENARVVLDMTSEMAGDFVVASAGPDMESVIAGKGSGAAQRSRDEGSVIVNLDIGGGTTNIAVFAAGETVGVGCYDIGGRLVRLSQYGRIEYISVSAALVAKSIGVDLRVGHRADAEAIAALASAMNSLLEEAVGAVPRTALLEEVATSGSSRLSPPKRIDAICFSGGVADCIYSSPKAPFAYGDMGVLLGRAIVAGRLAGRYRQVVPGETIRATVIGAGSYAITVSGSTVGYAQGVLPKKGLYAVTLSHAEEMSLYRGDGDSLKSRLLQLERNGGEVALFLRGLPNPGYAELKRAAECIVAAFDGILDFATPLFVAVERDMGKALALCMERIVGKRRAVVCVDGISLSEGDYLDLGNPVMGGIAIPVAIKTLVFG